MILNIIDFLKNNKLLVAILTIVLLLICIVLMWVFKAKKEKIKSNEIACIGIFSALSIVLYFLKFNLPFIFPSFLEINFSLLPAIIIGFMFGPIEGITIIFLRAVIKIPYTSTFCVGEVADLLIGIPVILVTSLMYKRNHTKKGALISLSLGSLTWVLTSIFANYFINVPFFISLYFNGDVSGFISMLSVIPNVNESNYIIKYILFAVIPFNLLISVIVNLVTFLVYKKISILFNKTNKKQIEIKD